MPLNINTPVRFVPYPPPMIDALDIYPNGHLFSNEDLKWAYNQFLRKKKEPDKYSKHDFNKDFSIMVVSNEGIKKAFAIYEGKLGEGEFGGVKLGVDIETGEWVAIKIIAEGSVKKAKPKSKKKKNLEDEKAEESENLDMGGTSNIRTDVENVSKAAMENSLEAQEYTILAEIGEAKGELRRTSPSKEVKQQCIVMKLASGQSLDNLTGIGDERRLQVMLLLVKTFQELIETRRILHRDIKPQNIMYDPRTHTLQIIDYGAALKIPLGQRSIVDKIVGTPLWADPEIGKHLNLANMKQISESISELVEVCLDRLKEIDKTEKSLTTNQFDDAKREVVDKCLELLTEKKPSVQLKQIEKALKSPRLHRKLVLLDEYLIFLRKNEIENADKIKEVEDFLKIKPKSKEEREKLIQKMDLALRDFSQGLNSVDQSIQDLMDQLNELSKKSTLNDIDLVKYLDFAQTYLETLKSKQQDDKAEIEEKLDSLKDFNKENPRQNISQYAEHLQKETELNLEKPRWKDIAIMIEQVESHLQMDNAKTTKTLLEETKALTIEITKIINKESANDETEKTERYKQLQINKPQVELGQVEYSPQSDIYSIGLILLSLVKDIQDPKLREKVLEKIFLNANWEDWFHRPNFDQLSETIVDILSSFQQIKLPNTCLMVDCRLLLDDKHQIDDTKINALLDQLKDLFIGEIMLVGHDDLPFQYYTNLRAILEKTGIPIRQEVALLSKEIPTDLLLEETIKHDKKQTTDKVESLQKIILQLDKLLQHKLAEQNQIQTAIETKREKKASLEKDAKDNFNGSKEKLENLEAQLKENRREIDENKEKITQATGKGLTEDIKNLTLQQHALEEKAQELETMKKSQKRLYDRYERQLKDVPKAQERLEIQIKQLDNKQKQIPNDITVIQTKISEINQQISHLEKQQKTFVPYTPPSVKPRLDSVIQEEEPEFGYAMPNDGKSEADTMEKAKFTHESDGEAKKVESIESVASMEIDPWEDMLNSQIYRINAEINAVKYEIKQYQVKYSKGLSVDEHVLAREKFCEDIIKGINENSLDLKKIRQYLERELTYQSGEISETKKGVPVSAHMTFNFLKSRTGRDTSLVKYLKQLESLLLQRKAFEDELSSSKKEPTKSHLHSHHLLSRSASKSELELEHVTNHNDSKKKL